LDAILNQLILRYVFITDEFIAFREQSIPSDNKKVEVLPGVSLRRRTLSLEHLIRVHKGEGMKFLFRLNRVHWQPSGRTHIFLP